MRLTLALQMPQLRKRMKDLSWKRWRKPPVNDLGLEAKLRKEGIPVVDANEFVHEMDKELYPVDWRTLPDAEPVFPQPPKQDRSHPFWKDDPVLMFDSTAFPIDGAKQALAFTKSVQVMEGLPEELMKRAEFPADVRERAEGHAERVTKQAFLWDSYTEKLPNLMNFDYPTRKFKVPLGTPLKRSNEILTRNFIRLIEQEDPSTATSRALTFTNDQDFRANIVRHGCPVQFRLTPLMSILSKNPLTSFLPENDVVAKSQGLELPSIHPFLSTTNFKEANIYEAGDFFAVKKNSRFPFIHTTIFSHHIPGSHTHIYPRWNDDRFTGSSILYGFATALLMAHQRFGDNIKGTLPQSVTTQVVHLTGKEFQFCVFQLNTLDLEEDSDSKVKNIVWLTKKLSLFSHIENKLGTEICEGFSPEPLRILRGMYNTPTM